MEVKRKIIFRTALFILLDFLAVVAIREMAHLYGELLWFKSLHYSPVFWTIFLTKWSVWFIFGMAFVLVAGINIYLARKIGAPKNHWELSYRTQEPGGVKVIPLQPEQVDKLLIVACLLLGGLMGLWPALRSWDSFLRFLYQKPFAQVDPIFHRDIGFFVFTYPIYVFLQQWLFCALLITSVLVGYIYVKDKAMNLKPGEISFTRRAKVHLSVLNGFILLLIAWDSRLKLLGLLYSNRGVVFGAGYTDMNAQLIAYWVFIVIAAVCALVFWFNTSAEGWKWPLIGLATLFALSILGNNFYPWVFQKLVVQPNELTKEEPYIQRNIQYTRAGYNLDKIEERDFQASANLTLEDIRKNSPTLKNVKLWDKSPLKQTYRELQEMRLYYSFVSVDEDRYLLDGKKTQIMLSVRELDQNNLPPQAQTFENRYFKYTHGYGLCMNLVNDVTEKGLPNLIVKDIPPASQSLLNISRPEIYYGEKTKDFVIVNTKSQEFDYPKGDTNVYTKYREKSSVPIGSFFNRLVFSIKYLEPRILFTNYLTPQSRILIHRQIKDRVKTLAPFLTYDRDPYVVVSDAGRIFWILDAYTTTDMYPYSERIALASDSDLSSPVMSALSADRKAGMKMINYIRNSVKITIDAYSGETTFYMVDEEEPIIRTYRRIYPRLFKHFSRMPQDLRAHIRYPRDLFEIQAHMYRLYHMSNAQVFYNKEDLWDLPLQRGVTGQTGSPMRGYYLTMRLPDYQEEEFLLMVPFTPDSKSNMIAWMCARCDGPDYGKLLVYKLPKEKLIYGPRQIEARIDQQTEISSQLTLWSQQGSDVFRGDLLVIPIEESILYVEPVYLLANDRSNVPELKRVIVAYGEKIEMKQTLSEALQEIFGQETAQVPSLTASQDPHLLEEHDLCQIQPAGHRMANQSIIDLARRVTQCFQASTDSFRKGDWAGYGRHQEQLGQVIRDLSAALQESDKMRHTLTDHQSDHQSQPHNPLSDSNFSSRLAHRQ
ncbi:MAG: UPF0182 family protein [bacterium]